jgi:hypothetical protein
VSGTDGTILAITEADCRCDVNGSFERRFEEVVITSSSSRG